MNQLMTRIAVLLVVLLLKLVPASAQDQLLSPEAFLGYEIGTRFTPHHRVVDYLRHTAATSDRVRLEEYGTTYEGRPLMVAYVGTPEAISRLEEIRRVNLARVQGESASPPSQSPAVVWLSYNVHGNEASSTEAALRTLYSLIDPLDRRLSGLLKDVVVILDPCLNPDGRERYVQWYRQTVGATPDPDVNTREHQEPWPGGRSNHYYFDLNRDWAWQTQQETRNRIALYQRWMPHIHADFHEQYIGEPYFFPPSAEPIHAGITEWQRELKALIGGNHARYFDAQGWLYFTGEVFDLFYPGFGDTWPMFNGAVGLTYEQGGHGRAGLSVITPEGDTLTLADRVRHHHATALSPVEVAARHRERIVTEFGRYFEQARTGAGASYRTYVVRPDKDRQRLDDLTTFLTQQQIQYAYARERRRIRARAYATGRDTTMTTEPGDLIVPATQTSGVLARVLFEPQPVLTDSLTYDFTAWALPYAYGLEAFATPESIGAEPTFTEARPADASTEISRPYAYSVSPGSFAQTRFISRLMRKGINLRYSEKALTIGGRAYEPGALIITRAGNAAVASTFDADIQEAARETGIRLDHVVSGRSMTGPDLGSGSVRFISPVRIGMAVGDELSSSAIGEVWHYFDQELSYPLSLLPVRTLSGGALRDLHVLILPHGNYGELLTDARLAEIKAWVRSGGRLIVMEGALRAVAGKEGFNLPKERKIPEDDSTRVEVARFESRERTYLPDEVPGSVYRVDMDDSHPLGFGSRGQYYSLKRSNLAYPFLEEGWNVGVLRRGTPVSGFAGYRTRQQLENSLVFGVQDMGQGTIIYMVDSPLVRGFWHAGKQIFGNAVFLTGGL